MECPKNSKAPFKCLNAEISVTIIVISVSFFSWIVASIFSVQAKAERVINIENKVERIYDYLIENKSLKK